MYRAARQRGASKGFTAVELLVVIGVIMLLAGFLVGVLIVGDWVQINRCKADIRTLEALLTMYHEDTGTYPTGGICGLVRALSYPDCGWPEACLTEYAIARSLSVPLDQNNRRIYKQTIHQEGSTTVVDNTVQYYTNPVTGEVVMGAIPHSEKVVVGQKDDPFNGESDDIERPVLTLIDPWGNEYVYLSAMEFVDPPGPREIGEMISSKDYARNQIAAEPAYLGTEKDPTGGTVKQFCGEKDGYQIYSFGPDRLKISPSNNKAAAKDNITSWASL